MGGNLRSGGFRVGWIKIKIVLIGIVGFHPSGIGNEYNIIAYDLTICGDRVNRVSK